MSSPAARFVGACDSHLEILEKDEATVSLADDLPLRDYPVALRHAMERMHAVAEERNRYHCSWQSSAKEAAALKDEVAALRSDLALLRDQDATYAEVLALRSKGSSLETQTASLKAQLAALRAEASDLSTRLTSAVSELDSVTNTPGFRFLTRLRVLRWHLQKWANLAPSKDASTDSPPTIPESPAVAPPAPPSDSPALPSDSPVPAEPDHTAGIKVLEVKELDYSPLSWNLDEISTDADGLLQLVILSANHRAGSTLLQRICNARQGTLIWGEHGGVLRHYAEVFSGVA